MSEPIKIALVSVGSGITGYIIYRLVLKSKRLQQIFETYFGSDRGKSLFILFTKYLGCLSIGGLPLLACFSFFPFKGLKDYGLWWNPETGMETLLWTLGICILVVPIVYITVKQPRHLVNYPEIRVQTWSYSLLFSYLFSWVVYLFGYELFFRGILFFPIADELGLWPAIVINVLVYASAHFPKGRDELVGSIPLSIALCLLCHYTGTFWIAFFVHVVMGWTNCLTGLKYNKEMKIGG